MKKNTKKFGLLIVDDEPRIREIYKGVLEDHYILKQCWDTINDCEDGESALTYIKEYKDRKKYHLIVVADAYMGPNCVNNNIEDANKLFGGFWLIDQVNKNDDLKEFVTILLITFHDERVKSYRMGNDLFKWFLEKDYYFVEKPRTNPNIRNQINATEALSKIEEQSEIKKLFEKTFEIIQVITEGRENEESGSSLDYNKKFMKKPPRILLIDHDEKGGNKECNVRVIGRSEALTDSIDISEKVAKSNLSILLKGESGTGKDLFAKLIHHKSLRRNHPLIIINCAAIPDSLIESEIFGHEKGAFTGADRKRCGKFELADGGSLFLDEVGDMSLSNQAKLLRVLEDGCFERVGGEKTINSNVRLITATNKDLEKEIKEGRFREDLYFRLNIIEIPLLPLRERKEDIPLLVKHFLNEFNSDPEIHKNCSFASGAIELFSNYSWPGNIRELQGKVGKLIVLSKSDVISEEEVRKELAKKPVKKVIFNDIISFKDLEKEYAYYMLEKTKKVDGKWDYKAAEKMCGGGFLEDKMRGIVRKNKDDDPRFQNKAT